MISVLVPTNRIGGLDVLFDSLACQTDGNFELVLIDNIWRYRRELVADKCADAKYPFRVKHIEPRDNPFPKVCYCRTMNTGIEHAAGETLLYLCDYCWLGDDVIATHAEIQGRHRGPLLLDFAYTPLPKLKQEFRPFVHTLNPEADPAAFTEELDRVTAEYVEALESGSLDSLMWSIFEESPTDQKAVWDLGVTHTHYKNAEEGAFTDWNYCCFKNESFPTELMVNMNGHDEDYDTSHGWQDSEFSYRLKHIGLGWWCGTRFQGEIRCLNPREVLNIKQQPNIWQYNKYLCDHYKRADKALPVNPDWSIRERREEKLG